MKSITLEMPDPLADLLASEALRARAVGVLALHFAEELRAAAAESAPALVFSAGTSAAGETQEPARPKGFDPDAVRRRMSALLGPAPGGSER